MSFLVSSFFSISSLILATNVDKLSELAQAQPIYGGQEVETCGWPTVVGVREKEGLNFCTGTLIHPEIVIYAAHCGGGTKRITFGEHVWEPQHMIETSDCVANPDYNEISARDWAFCRLPEPINLPTTPILFGCEQDILKKDIEVVIAGFGQNISDEPFSAGPKRWGVSKIVDILDFNGTIVSVGSQGYANGCAGDSGGPIFVQMEDGSWHTAGILADQIITESMCVGISVYALASNAVAWIEEASGLDITPCYNVDGTWNPSPECGHFATNGAKGEGTWDTWCTTENFVEKSSTCGPPYYEGTDTTPPSVMIASPQNAVYADKQQLTLTVDVMADDNDGWGVKDVKLRINGETLPTADLYPPYQFTDVELNAEGSWELVAIAEDFANHVAESKPVIIHLGPVEQGTSTGDDEPSGSSGSDGEETGEQQSTSNASDSGTGSVDEDSGGCGCQQIPSSPWNLAYIIVFSLILLSRSRSIKHT